MDLINNYFDSLKKEIETAFDTYREGKCWWDFTIRLSKKKVVEFQNFQQALCNGSNDEMILPSEEVVKLLFIYSFFYLMKMMEIKKHQSREKYKDFDKAALFENGRIVPDDKKILETITRIAFLGSLGDSSEKEIYENLEMYKEKLSNLDAPIKYCINDLCHQNFYTVEEVVSFFGLKDNNENYFSMALFLKIRKSFRGFVESGKCTELVFPFLLVILLDFLNNKGIEQGQKLFSEEVISFFYYIVYSYDETVFLSFYSDMVMNKIFIDTLLSNYAQNTPLNEEIKKSWIQSYYEKFPQYFCFSFVDENRFLQILKIGKEDTHSYYDSLLKLYNLTFEKENAGAIEAEKEKNVRSIFADVLEKYNNDIFEYPGFCFCFAKLIRYLGKNEIQNLFGKKDVISFKQEWDKVSRAKEKVYEGFGPIDTETFKFIWDPQTQNELNEVFKKRSLLLEGIFYAQLYLLLNSVRGDLLDFDFNQAVWKLCQNFHNSFIHPDYIAQIKKNKILNDFSNIILAKDLFSELIIDCENNNEEVISVVYYLSRYYTDKLHATIDFLNHVREKQLIVLPVLPNKFLSYTKEEAEKEKLMLEENQKILKEQIDPGFTIPFQQFVSKITFQVPVIVHRRMTIKSFVETDKKLSIVYYQKAKKTNDYYRLDKKEDFRVTNKNHLENHYLYPDRNVFTHNSSNYMIIENLLDEDKAESLLYALYDIKKFLNRLENESREEKARLEKMKKENKQKGEPDLYGEIYLAGIIYLQNEFSALQKKMWKVIIPHNVSDPWKEVFSKDEIRPEYKEKLSNLDYNHDFGPSFLKMLNDFLVKIYFASPEFLDMCSGCIFIYLIFQNFALEKFRPKEVSDN